MKAISTRMHGILDYVSAAGLLAVPRLLGWDKGITGLLTGAAGATVAYSLLTRYELGLFKVIPMKGHLALDGLQSLLLGTAPFLFFKGVRKSTAAGLLGISLYETLVVLNSQTEPEEGES